MTDTSDSDDDIISRDQYDEIYGDDRRPKTTINKGTVPMNRDEEIRIYNDLEIIKKATRNNEMTW